MIPNQSALSLHADRSLTNMTRIYATRLLSRLIERLLGWFFRPFNRFFKASSDSYQGAVSRTLGRRGVVFMVYVVLLAGTGLMFNAVPRGFIPTQDSSISSPA
jgi:multidrug efflux pump subunit AcrB